MHNELILLFEKHFFVLLVFHGVLSALATLFLINNLKERYFSKEKELVEKDLFRLQLVSNESLLFKLFFEVSLRKNNLYSSALFFYLFNFTLPLMGLFLSIWVAFYLKNVEYKGRVAKTNILNLDEFGMTFQKVERIFGEGSMADLMLSEYAPKSKKLKALSSLAANLSPANLKIVKQTLFSTDDEIRMFGYAVVNKAEQALSSKISHQLSIFQREDEKGEEAHMELRASAAKELAFLYWEMVYIELAHDNLKANFLKDVEHYIKIAKEFYEPEIKAIHSNVKRYTSKVEKAQKKMDTLEDPKEKEKERKNLHRYINRLEKEKKKYAKYVGITVSQYTLMGRMYMSRGDLERAHQEFLSADKISNGSSTSIIPYLAEVNFLKGNYQEVKHIMNSAKSLEFNGTLYPIVEQWKVRNV